MVYACMFYPVLYPSASYLINFFTCLYLYMDICCCHRTTGQWHLFVLSYQVTGIGFIINGLLCFMGLDGLIELSGSQTDIFQLNLPITFSLVNICQINWHAKFPKINRTCNGAKQISLAIVCPVHWPNFCVDRMQVWSRCIYYLSWLYFPALVIERRAIAWVFLGIQKYRGLHVDLTVSRAYKITYLRYKENCNDSVLIWQIVMTFL